MKTLKLFSLLIALLVGSGCQKPCTTTTFKVNLFTGDTIFTERSYAICGDTLSYYERQVKSDSTIISEGEVLNGKKEGEWLFKGWRKELINYSRGIEISRKEFDENGALTLQHTLEADSLYSEKQFYEDGTVMLRHSTNMEGFLIGRGIDYDTLGRKTSEGEYIAEYCMTDTIYIPSPDPPYDLQMTIVSELGGKHGPWVNYDGEGNVTDTTIFDHGIPLGEELRFKSRWKGIGTSPKPAPSNELLYKKPEPLDAETKEFEGRVTYKIEENYAIFRGGWRHASVGTKCEIFYKQGKWLEKTNGKSFDWRLYLPYQNRVYTSHIYHGADDEKHIIWMAGGYFQNAQTVMKVEVNENAETILGHDCDQLILYTNWDTLEYFFSRDLPLNYRHFEKCRTLHFNVWTRYAQAMPLKMVFASNMGGKLKYTLTATSIQPLKIEDRVFTMPIDGRKTEPDWTDEHLDYIKGGGL